MKKARYNYIWGSIAAVIGFFFVIAELTAQQRLDLASGTVTSRNFLIGNAICSAFNAERAHDHSQCGVTQTASSADNLRQLAEGRVHLGLVRSDVLHEGLAGEIPDLDKLRINSLHAIMKLHVQPLRIIARTNFELHRFTDLENLRIAIEDTHWASVFSCPACTSGCRCRNSCECNQSCCSSEVQSIFPSSQSYAVNNANFVSMNSSQMEEQILSNQIDLALFFSDRPESIFPSLGASEAFSISLGYHFVEETIEVGPHYCAVTLDSISSSQPHGVINTFGRYYLLIASADLPDEIVHRIVYSFSNNLDSVKGNFPLLEEISSIDDLLPNEELIDIHLGAQRFFREVGLID